MVTMTGWIAVRFQGGRKATHESAILNFISRWTQAKLTVEIRKEQGTIRDFVQMPWLVTRYAKDMAAGDGVLIWKAGQDAGIYAIAELIEPPKMLDKVPDIGYWIDKTFTI